MFISLAAKITLNNKHENCDEVIRIDVDKSKRIRLGRRYYTHCIELTTVSIWLQKFKYFPVYLNNNTSFVIYYTWTKLIRFVYIHHLNRGHQTDNPMLYLTKHSITHSTVHHQSKSHHLPHRSEFRPSAGSLSLLPDAGQ